MEKIASLLLSLLICLSTTYSPVLAAGDKAAPTAVTECSVTGFMTEILTLGFEDMGWMNAINNVVVNDTTYTKEPLTAGVKRKPLGSRKCDRFLRKLHSPENRKSFYLSCSY